MKKNIPISIFLFFLIFLAGCKKCYYFYSNNEESAIIKESLFDLESRINSYPEGEMDELEVSIYYKDSLSYKIIRNSVRIYPRIVNKKDTIGLIREYASHYYFEFYKKWPEKIDIGLQFDMDSSGIKVHRYILFKELEKNNNCQFRIAVH